MTELRHFCTIHLVQICTRIASKAVEVYFQLCKSTVTKLAGDFMVGFAHYIFMVFYGLYM